jgi:Uma2 family endonuclease
VRRPDVSFIHFGRLQNEVLPKGHIEIPPDLVVEVISPNDLYGEVKAKVREYQLAGIRLVWLIDPDGRSVEVYRANRSVSILSDEDELEGEDVLPGFRCRIMDILPPKKAVAGNEVSE